MSHDPYAVRDDRVTSLIKRIEILEKRIRELEQLALDKTP